MQPTLLWSKITLPLLLWIPSSSSKSLHPSSSLIDVLYKCCILNPPWLVCPLSIRSIH